MKIPGIDSGDCEVLLLGVYEELYDWSVLPLAVFKIYLHIYCLNSPSVIKRLENSSLLINFCIKNNSYLAFKGATCAK